MNNIIEAITQDNKQFYNFVINFGNFKNYYFNNYLSKQDYDIIISKFTKFNIKEINEYSYLNMNKIFYKNTKKIIFYKKDFVKSYLIKNTIKNNNKIKFLLLKENKNTYINPYEFPNIKEKIMCETKKIYSYKSINNNTEIIINFVEINNKFYSINLEFNFDKKNKKKIILHLDILFKKIFNNFNFIQL